MKLSPRLGALWIAVALLAGAALLIQISVGAEPQELKTPLVDMPRELGPWSSLGPDGVLDQPTLDLLGPEDYLLRTYALAQEGRAALFLAYFPLQIEGKMIHSPRHCLPGSGWGITSRDVARVETPDGPVEVNHLILAKDLDRLSVLYWYQGRGRVVADEYTERALLIWDGMLHDRSEGTLVRITMSLSSQPGRTLAQEQDLASRVIPALNRLMPPLDGEE